MALKLDLSKAYDRVEWQFLSAMMLRIGFSPLFSFRIMDCETSVKFQILINEGPSTSFSSTRGIMQGDPISSFPLIF